MISLLRGLMASDGNTNRPFPSLLLLGIFDFCCILIGLEQISVHKITSGIIWIAIGVVSGLIGYYWPQIWRTKKRKISAPAFEIIFDPNNPGHQFWSPKRDSGGNSGVEYRIKVRNITDKTIYEVKATSERIGPMGALPVSLVFDLTEATTFTLDPEASVFVRLFFAMTIVNKAGMLSGKSATAYGPVKVVVSALDTPAVERLFQFDPWKEPMIFENPSSN
jgi:hypothetical protein